MASQEEVVRAVEAAVRAEMSKHDSSHDFFHIERVQKTAVRLAREEGAWVASQPCVRV
jgi:HD superfamily phosphodiesterase